MIDIENMIFDAVSKAVKAKYPIAQVFGEYVESPARFPCVTIVEDSNITYRKTQDETLPEHHATLMYSVNCYSDKAGAKKAQCKEIADIVDRTMQDLKFTRTMAMQTPSVDRTIYRITARYTAVVAAGYTNEDGNTVYQLYRK